MERSEALDKYVTVVNTCQQLAEQRLALVAQLNNLDAEMDNVGREANNLRQFILAKIDRPQRVNPNPLNKLAKHVDITGPTQLAIIKVMREHEGEELTSKKIAEYASMSYNPISCAMTKLVKWGIVNMDKSHGTVPRYTLAVHSDQQQ